ncbi:ArsR/SmtB family transcription factor [Ornithinibacillus scapharcae]|uniref:ArsR/SmtB family transcription factor n=1 Tax=Ornithinibacillus scapharcae TaxID=1147159 RepID=UPI000225BA51|nr:metalloregulator ArsR/SmtB family transcription factor [Ornithinibacillus scapharcae]
MEVINLTSRKRQTYQVQFEYSLLWEAALGIAAFTNKTMLDSLEKPLDFWPNSLSTITLELLHDVERNNTWKALLQLLHRHHVKELSAFTSYIMNLSEEDLKYICLPFVSSQSQGLRKAAASGEQTAVENLKKLIADNSFFPSYIDYIYTVDGDQLKNHLTQVMEAWYEEVIHEQHDKLHAILQTDYETKKQMAIKMDPEKLVEWATGGVTYIPEPQVTKVLLIPQYIYRPWNIEADIEDTKVFYYPVANESITPTDRFTPNHFLVLKYKALGDEVRLRIVKLLFEGERTLHDITTQLEMGKSTIHHHLKILRSAKLVEIIDSKYALKKNTLNILGEELDMYLEK